MTFTIIKTLGINYRTYNDVRHSYFTKWCSKIAHDYAIPHRYLVKNDHLYNWYLTQWINYVEFPYVNECKIYVNAKIDDPDSYQKLFHFYPSTIYDYYPNELLKKIKIELQFKNKLKNA